MIQVIHRALNLLEFIAQHPNREYSLTEIADQHQLNHGTCANILKTLVIARLRGAGRPQKGLPTRPHGLPPHAQQGLPS